jgi:ribose transport system permease protein
MTVINRAGKRWLRFTLNQATIVLFAMVIATFGLLSPRFLEPANLINILVQTASPAIVATGMTFVLLTAGVDLSVGAIMFVCAAVAGKFVSAGGGVSGAILLMLGAGVFFGAFNGLLVTRLRIAAFVATLGTLYVGRGIALWMTETRAMNLPYDGFPRIASSSWLGVPVPLWLMLAVVVIAHVTLTRTAYGRQIHAAGESIEAAAKAGLRVNWLLASVYLISGLCAAVGAIITLGQLGAVSPKFGETREFTAIAAAVLGGTSLFGGRGQVLPGTLMGAVLIQSIENGLVILNADPYLYPLIASAIIFFAVLMDSSRKRWLVQMTRRRICPEEAT